MTANKRSLHRTIITLASCCVLYAASAQTAFAQTAFAQTAFAQIAFAQPAPPAASAVATAALPARMERLPGVWVEGRGFEVTYGKAYPACAQRCLAQPACLMIEYYRPQRKCNLYNSVRPTLPGGASDVAVRR